jgi:hypothetical protein
MKIAKRWMAIVLTFVPVLVVALTMAGNAAAGNAKVLILDPSVAGGAASLEAVAAGDAGEGVDVVDAETWSAMTTEDFAAYDAIVIGDGRCDADQSAAVANAATWSAAVTGNVIAIGLDPGYHATYGYNESGANALIAAGIRFAVADSTHTGAYLSIGCQSNADLLSELSSEGFGFNDVSGDTVHVVASSPPAELAGLNDEQLSDWGSSYHAAFTSYPAEFTPFAVGGSEGSDGPVIVTRGVSGATTTAASPRGGYCSAPGNTNPMTGKVFAPGSFLDLTEGQADSDPHYKGAMPANYLEGVGITCDTRSGFTKTGQKVGYGGLGDPGSYDYFKKG